MKKEFLRQITNEEEHLAALERFSHLFEPEPGTSEYDEFYLLGLVIHDYESKHHAIEPPPSLEMLKFRMEQMGIRPRDLVGVIGSSGRVSEVLHGRRGLTVRMIAELRKKLNLSADYFIDIAIEKPKHEGKAVHSGRQIVAEPRASYGKGNARPNRDEESPKPILP